MHGFLSVSKNRETALQFHGGDERKIFITIIVPGQLQNCTQSFAEIKDYSDFAGEEEVLFNVMSQFKILKCLDDDVADEQLGIKARHLVLLFGNQAIKCHLKEG